MKKSLRSLARNNPSDQDKEASIDPKAHAEVKELIAEYSSKSENELMNELLSAVSKQKAEGSFDPSALSAGIEAIMPMLNEEQKRRLIDITGRL